MPWKSLRGKWPGNEFPPSSKNDRLTGWYHDGTILTGGATVRSIGTCNVCGDPRREIVSRGRCAKCLMQERREAQRRGEPVHNPAEYTYLKELNKYLGRFVKAVTALEDGQIPDTFISSSDHQTVRRIIRESIDRIQAEKKASEHRSGVIMDGPQPVNDGLPEPEYSEEPEVGDAEPEEPLRLVVVNPEPRLTVKREPVAAKDEES